MIHVDTFVRLQYVLNNADISCKPQQMLTLLSISSSIMIHESMIPNHFIPLASVSMPYPRSTFPQPATHKVR